MLGYNPKVSKGARVGAKEDTGLICEAAENPKSFIPAAALKTGEITALGRDVKS